MFFIVPLTRNIELPPTCFHKMINQKINDKLMEEVQGQCMGDYGFVVCVTEVEDIGQGKIRDDIPEVSFPVQYRAIVFRPFRNEVLDGLVTQVDQAGVFVAIGPLTVYVSKANIPKEYELDDQAQPHWAYKSAEDDSTITVDTMLRLKLLNVRVELTEMHAVGTINQDYLGVID